ncbi:unnamed protein product [Cuscuta europaea]|nr:unnamed protein product [Cuscuta europaea]
MMNVRGLADLKKKKSSKAPRATDAGVPKPAGDFFKKPEGPSAAPYTDAASSVKRKGACKAPDSKKPKTGDAGKKSPPVVIVDDCPASGVHEEMTMAEVPGGAREPSSEVLTVSLPVGTAVMNGTTDPRVLLRLTEQPSGLMMIKPLRTGSSGLPSRPALPSESRPDG